ncbi:MAG: hypothetical protein ACYSWZ_07730 [Planctomycetota bacterium]|jgi:hypothetical protein
MKSLNDIEKTVTKFNVNPGPEMRSRVLDEALGIHRKQMRKSTSGTYRWRIIMKSRIAKFSAAAVAIMAIYMCVQGLVPTAYAFEDTVEAYSSIHWLYVKEFTMVGQEKRTSELWVECDDDGRPIRFRYQTPNAGPIGAINVVNDGTSTDTWLPRFNVCYRTPGHPHYNAIALLQWDITKTDPKRLCERLFEEQERGEAILDIVEPDQKNKSIVVTVTHPQESPLAGSKNVLYIDQATKLVTKVEFMHHFPDGRDQHYRTAEFFDYNQEIDQEMFSFEGELPGNVIRVDQSGKEIGLAQGDMSDKQVAVELTRKYFEALIAEDYTKAGLLYGGAPGFVVEGYLMGAKILKITSVGQAYREGPGSNAMVCSCKGLIEFNGQTYELDADMVRMRPVSSQPVRWAICGTSTKVAPHQTP